MNAPRISGHFVGVRRSVLVLLAISFRFLQVTSAAHDVNDSGAGMQHHGLLKLDSESVSGLSEAFAPDYSHPDVHLQGQCTGAGSALLHQKSIPPLIE